MAKPVHEISTESLGTSGTVETFLRSEVRHIKARGYAFNAYLVSRDERHPEVSIYQLTQSDGFAITADAGRFSVVKLRAAVESLTSPEMHARMLACKSAVRAMHAPSATALVPVAQAVLTVGTSERAEAAADYLRRALTVEAVEKCDKCGNEHTQQDIDGGRCIGCGTLIYSATDEPSKKKAAKKAEAAVKPPRKPRKPKAKPSTTALVPVAKPGKAVYVPPKVGETWQDAKGERRVIQNIVTEDGATDIIWLESRPEPDGSYDPDNSYLAMCQPEAFRRWERKMGGKRT